MKRLAWELWHLSTKPEAFRFEWALRHPEAAQKNVLRSVLQSLNKTQYAKCHDLNKTLTVEEYRLRAPVMKSEDLAYWTQRIVAGESSVLTTDSVERLIPTSGSTGAAKLIPMTAASRHEYSLAVRLWMHDLFSQWPQLKKGSAYIATSPALTFKRNESKVPIGYAEDEAYLGKIEKQLLASILAVPTSVSKLKGEDWKQEVRSHLASATDLRLLSLWHPSYLEAIFSKEEMSNLHRNWPDLQVISAWSDGVCGGAANKLMDYFPGVRFQPKGLWLTEGVISVPWQGKMPLSLLTGFLEFEDVNGNLFLAHELRTNQRVRPLLTNHAGLIRYRLGDEVQVTGFLKNTPCIEWLGRLDAVSDLCGEKLSEAQVQLAFQKLKIEGEVFLKPNAESAPPCYQVLSDEKVDLVKLERLLRQNPNYEWARSIGQLGPIHQRPFKLPVRQAAGQKVSIFGEA